MWGEEPSVVVVDDDAGCRDLYTHWFGESCSVFAVDNSEDALATISERTDLVLLDREMPGMDGETVVERLRTRGYDGYVVMVTGVEPDFDIVEMPVDNYLVKPVIERELTAVVDRLATRADYHEQLRELFALSAKKARLEVEKSDAQLQASEEYDQLGQRLADQRRAVRRAFDDAYGADWLAAFEACAGGPTAAGAD